MTILANSPPEVHRLKRSEGVGLIRRVARLDVACPLAAFLIFFLILALTFLPRPEAQAQTAAQTPRPAATPSGNAQNGVRVYGRTGCYQCHGNHAQGSSATGPRLGPRPISFDAFKKYVRAPVADMPPYTAKVVSDAELADIYAFLQSLPQPPRLEDIPLLK